MKVTRRFTILGCASSPGVPRINGDWGACDPEEPRNRRSRAALLVEQIGEEGRTAVVIDTGPDFRTQMIGAGVTAIDAVLYSHPHADHIHGIDDLRGFALAMRRKVPVYGDRETLARLREGFRYCFETPPGSNYPPIVEAHEIGTDLAAITVEGAGGAIDFEPLEQSHGDITSLGFRIGDVAYCSDVSDFPEHTAKRLTGLQTLIIDALQYRPHPSHFSLGQALEWIERLAPAKAYLTHMHTPLDYRTVAAALPDHVQPAYDLLVFEEDVRI